MKWKVIYLKKLRYILFYVYIEERWWIKGSDIFEQLLIYWKMQVSKCKLNANAN